MQAEFDALLANDTWSLVPHPRGVNLVTSKWVYRHKLLAYDTLDCYKACWVLRGFTQRPDIIMMRLSVWWSSQLQYVWFCLWLYLRIGLFISWILKMCSFVAL